MFDIIENFSIEDDHINNEIYLQSFIAWGPQDNDSDSDAPFFNLE